jgi:serine/threonine protein kinase/tetratricopeptide (TPR) repeat protein
MGIVYRGQDPETGETVAVKTVSGLNTERIQGLRAEISALTRIRHPGLVRVIRHGVEDGAPWFSMDLLPGRNLSAYNDALWAGRGVQVERTTELPTLTTSVNTALGVPTGTPAVITRSPRSQALAAAAGQLAEVLTLYRRLLLALAYLHGKGFVHRDIKPSNVMVKPDGQPVLLDFGLAARGLGTIGRGSIETAGKLMGTVAYLAPEQIRREFVDARADLYSIGCMLYETVTGIEPFQARSVAELCRQHTETPPLPPSDLVSGLPPGLEQLILRLLAKTKRDRIGHAEEVVEVLEALGAAGGDGPAEVGSPFRLYRPELVGRDDPLGDLDKALDQLGQGMGRFIVLDGESGVGKTALASEVARRAGLRRLRVVGGDCVPPGVTTTAVLDIRSAPLHPFRNLFQAIADACQGGGEEVTRRLLGAHGRVLRPYSSVFESLPGQHAHPDPPELGSEENLRRLLDSFREVLNAFARTEQPLILILDDLQWADELTLKSLTALSGSDLAAVPLLVVGTFRSDEAHDALKVLLEAPRVIRHSLGRLQSRHLGRVIADMLGVASVPEPFVEHVALQSEGNPFFVAEYVRAAVGDGLVVRRRGSWDFTAQTRSDMDRLAVPRPVHELVGRRLQGLSSEVRNLLEHASVLGREVDLPLLTSIVKTDEPAVIALLNELRARQILESNESGRYRFGHDKLRELTYRAIPVDRRREMHRAAAEAMEPTVSIAGLQLPFATLAHHFANAENWTKAVDYFERAGNEALKNFANREAVSYLGSAIAGSKNLSGGVRALRRARWERGLVDAHLGLGEDMAARAHAEEALRHCGMPLPRSSAGFVTGLLVHTVRYAIQSRARSLFRVRAKARQQLLLEGSYILNRLFEPLLFANLPLQATYSGLRNLNLAQRLPPSVPFARGYASMSIVAGMIAPLAGVARAWARRSVEAARSLGDDQALIYALSRSSCFFITAAEWGEAERRLDEAREIAERIGDRRQFDEVVAVGALNSFFAGKLARSLQDGTDLAASGSARGDRQTATWGRNCRLQALIRLGRYEEASLLVPEILKWEEAPDLDKVYQYGNIASLFARLSDLTRARRYADLSLESLGSRRPAAYMLLNGLWGAAEAYLTIARAGGPGAWSERKDLREAILRTQRALGQLAQLMPFGRPAALLCKGMVLSVRGKEHAARRVLSSALKSARDLQMPYEAALIQLEMAGCLDAEEAAPLLTTARRDLQQLCAPHGGERPGTVLRSLDSRS